MSFAKSLTNVVVLTTAVALTFGTISLATSSTGSTAQATELSAASIAVPEVGTISQVQAGPAIESAAGAAAGRLAAMAKTALKLTTMAIPYQYGGGHGTVPAPVGSRVDCSGLIRALYYDAFKTDVGNGSGDSIVRLSGKFTRTAKPVVGDVALFGNGGQAPAYHAGVYVGNGPGGSPAIVAATQTGSNIGLQEFGTRYWGGDLMGYWHYNGATAADSATAPAKPLNAKGNIDKVSASNGTIKVVGWAFDPAKPTASSRYAIVVDGRTVAQGTAKKARSDIARSLKIGAAHGISVTVKVKAGVHTVALVAKAAAGSKSTAKKVDTATAHVTVKARGDVNVLSGGKRFFRVGGWTFDPQTPNSANRVIINVDGKDRVIIRADRMRKDVGRIFGITSRHGFDRRITMTPGAHMITVIAIGNVKNTQRVVLFRKAITVKK